MRHGLTVAMLALSMILGSALYQVSYSTMALERELGRTNGKIRETEKAKHVLAAEWSLLNAPARIEALARRHLGFVPLLGQQIVSIGDLPLARPVDAPGLVAEGIRPKSKPAELRGQAIASDTTTSQAQLATASDIRTLILPNETASHAEKFAAVINGLTR